MTHVRIALANIRIPATPDESVALALAAIDDASRRDAAIICFPECYIPGYRWPGSHEPPHDEAFMARAWAAVDDAAARGSITVVLGTERLTSRGLQITARVSHADGRAAEWQDKGQIDPAEEEHYPALGDERRVFTAGPLTFGISICHEGFRYPETVRWAARRGAQVVFHPHAHVATEGSYQPRVFADPANTFHEKALLCRAAENTCYIASVNAASEGCGTTSVVVRPDGTPQCWQPYGVEGLLIADVDLSLATRLLAMRSRVTAL